MSPILIHYIMNQMGIKQVLLSYHSVTKRVSTIFQHFYLSAPCACVPNTACFGYPCVPNARPFCHHFMIDFRHHSDTQAHPAPRYPTAVNQLLVHPQSVPNASFFLLLFCHNRTLRLVFYGRYPMHDKSVTKDSHECDTTLFF